MTAVVPAGLAPEEPLRFTLVDDAFATLRVPAPSVLSLFAGAYAKKGGDLSALLGRLPAKPALVEDLDKDDYNSLLEIAAADVAILEALRDASALPEQNPDKVHEIRRLLEEQFGSANVVAKSDISTPADVQEGSIVFLDYRLEVEGQHGAAAIDHAIDVARKLAEGGKHVPFVVLMSDQVVPEVDVAEFCRRAKLLRGSFEFVPKAELNKSWRLAYMVHALKAALPEIRTLRDLLLGLEKHAKSVAEAAMADLRAIAVSEWATCRAAALTEDGQRFSDYVVWLFSERIAAELEGWKNTAANYQELDRFLTERSALRVTALSLSAPPQGNALIRAYARASFIGAEQLRPLREGGQAQLSFGDVLGEADALKTDGAQVFAIVTPDCDLFDRLQRDPTGAQMVMMVEGTVRAIEHLAKEDEDEARQSKTFVETSSGVGDLAAITWHPSKVTTCEHCGFDVEPHPKKLNLLGRLRQSFASELKDDVVRQMSKTGVMIRPPHLAQKDVEFVYPDSPQRTVKAGAVAVGSRGGKYAALTRLGVEGVYEVAEELASKAGNNHKNPVEKAGTLAQGLLNAPGALSDLHTLAERKKGASVYKNPGATAPLIDVVELRDNAIPQSDKKAKPIQAVLTEGDGPVTPASLKVDEGRNE